MDRTYKEQVKNIKEQKATNEGVYNMVEVKVICKDRTIGRCIVKLLAQARFSYASFFFLSQPII